MAMNTVSDLNSFLCYDFDVTEFNKIREYITNVLHKPFDVQSLSFLRIRVCDFHGLKLYELAFKSLSEFWELIQAMK